MFRKHLKWALVTGSSRGLGREIAIELAQKSYAVVLHGRSGTQLDSVAQEIRSLGGTCSIYAIDLCKDGAPEQLTRQIRHDGISLSLLINNLGGGVPGDQRNIPLKPLRDALRLNLEVAIELNNLNYEALKVCRGVICHISSTAALHHDAPPGYVISKSALNAYIKNAARMFGPEGVTIFGIMPGMLEHEGSYIEQIRTKNPERYMHLQKAQVCNRFVTSRETARFLVSLLYSAVPMINGSLITFDGGIE